MRVALRLVFLNGSNSNSLKKDCSVMEWMNDAVLRISEDGWYHGASVIDSCIIADVSEWMDRQLAEGSFNAAGVGKGNRFQTDDSIRRDNIFWIPEWSDDKVISSLNGLVESIRSVLNRELFAGLDSFEGHLAFYPPGGFYRRHVDTFRDDDARKITFILYLNQCWKLDDGGELRLYTAGESYVDIEPTAGTVVLFKSRDFAHEVLDARSPRRSFTGWFKVRKINP